MVDFASLTKKLKSLSIEGIKETLKKPVGDGKRSSYKILSIAGETIALSNTGLDPTEKVLHNKDDFQRLYVPASLKGNQSDLEEILLRMFPLSSSQSKKEVLPPQDEDEFDLVRQSLHYRLETLRSEILDDTTDSVSVREKLSRFDRLNKLIDSLEKNFQKNRRQDYIAITASSSQPPSQEPKLDLSNEEVDRILRTFGIVLLQSKHQLPGFKFQTSPNQIIREVQSIQLDNEDDFFEEINKEEGEFNINIQDLIDPKSKESRLLSALQEKVEELVGNLGERLSSETIAKLNFDFQGKSFDAIIEGLLESLFAVVEDYEQISGKASDIIENLEAEIENLEEQLEECNQKLEQVVREFENNSSTSSESKSESNESPNAEIQALQQEKQGYLRQITKLKEQVLEQQTASLQREEATKKLTLATTELENLKNDLAEKNKTIASLKEKESQIESLQAKIKELEEREDTETSEEKTRELEKVSAEKQALEEKLADYDENLAELQNLVANVAISNDNQQKTPFEQLRSRIMSILPVKIIDDGSSSSPKAEQILNLPLFSIPSALEIKADLNSYFCDFLEALTQLVSTYFDSDEGQTLQTQFTTVLDSLHTSSTPAETAQLIQKLLLMVADVDPRTEENINDDAVRPLVEQQTLKDLQSQAESLFFSNHEDLRSQVEPMNKQLTEKDLPTYPVLFFLYLLALRDWVNCVEINSRPLQCPQIPERLQRKEIKCK
jgi:hypothetical protein